MRLLLSSAALTALLHVATALVASDNTYKRGQIPVVEGVIGGVPSSNEAATQDRYLSYASTAATPNYTVFSNYTGAYQGLKIRYIVNSGQCERTPGVKAVSGYLDIATNQSLFFWYFASRQAPASAPTVAWFNGGPGSSSMIGLFQENGPCRITNDSKSLVNNTQSWTNVANMVFIDQPVGAGYSYGQNVVGTSAQAAAAVYIGLQLLFQSNLGIPLNSFGIATESYGGHYGPVFSALILSNNQKLPTGAVNIPLKYLLVGDGLTNGLVQYPAYPTFAKTNPTGQHVSDATITKANTTLYKSGGCLSQIASCQSKPSNSVCSAAQSYCNNYVLSPLAGNQDVYFYALPSTDPYPADLTPLLTNSTFMASIGATSTWQQSSSPVYSNFARTGDWMYNSSPQLQTVINAGVRVHVFSGDRDYILNSVGVEALVSSLSTQSSSLYKSENFSAWTVAGQSAGLYKNAFSGSAKFSYLRLYGAGHEVPAYTYGKLAYGQAALSMFTQVIKGTPITST
ncbi:uncharacterized protein L969DRAFT_95229 [Mixia osmundae IAM 14324]|uniref:Carboxypeptidase n=1 Tax=Mixia osmundae (strain CBS 9802 / IAM 14324 / JCM 22182 / KY 12970) TaxID=764103 RepID=G7E6S6_MIXOS|nr:uncharacterized protein L969DRAFT_95229 [Mixia osmundae IAM 14324]KEI39081.1 hypothetical protein L969DRAFT_95229 [Mixia osmundae IAM 14324]GAA98536.1 hypothetical protein E5Q_05223 [Mixia osmundae IAM 14324]